MDRASVYFSSHTSARPQLGAIRRINPRAGSRNRAKDAKRGNKVRDGGIGSGKSAEAVKGCAPWDGSDCTHSL
jgi:hypothetical protein